jgi:hypothetical protein
MGTCLVLLAPDARLAVVDALTHSWPVYQVLIRLSLLVCLDRLRQQVLPERCVVCVALALGAEGRNAERVACPARDAALACALGKDVLDLLPLELRGLLRGGGLIDDGVGTLTKEAGDALGVVLWVAPVIDVAEDGFVEARLLVGRVDQCLLVCALQPTAAYFTSSRQQLHRLVRTGLLGMGTNKSKIGTQNDHQCLASTQPDKSLRTLIAPLRQQD